MIDDATLVERRLTSCCLQCGAFDGATHRGDPLCMVCGKSGLPKKIQHADILQDYATVIAWMRDQARLSEALLVDS